MLEARTKQYAGQVVVSNRWLPTSQMCSACGWHDGRKDLSVRQWQCPSCGAVLERDVNVAKTILAAGLAERVKTDVEPSVGPTLRWQQAVKRQPA